MNRCRKRAALTIFLRILARARATPLASGFDPGGAGRQVWGSFGARRSKPLAAGGCGVCVLRHFRLARPCSLSLGVRAPRRRAANPGRRCWPTARPAAVFYFGLGDRRWRSFSPIAARSSLSGGRCSEIWPSDMARPQNFGIGERPLLESASEKGTVNPSLCVSSRARRAPPRPAVSIRRRRRGAIG